MEECAVIKMTDTLKWAGTVPIHASEQRSWFVGCDQLSSVKKLFSSAPDVVQGIGYRNLSR